MKSKDIKQLADKTVAELLAELVVLQTDLAKKLHEKKVGKLSNPRLVSHLSDDVARYKTIIRHKELTEKKA
jgi:ribosomal protein L29